MSKIIKAIKATQAVIVVAPSVDDLAQSREAILASAIDLEKGKISLKAKLRAHGVLMSAHFDVIENGVVKCKWYDLKGKSKETLIDPEARLFYAMFPESNDKVKHLSPAAIKLLTNEELRKLGLFSQGTDYAYWSLVRKYSKPIDLEAVTEAAKTKVLTTDTLDVKNAKILLKMITKLDKAEPDSAPLSFKVVDLLVEAADLMGVDLTGLAIAG